MCVTESGRPDGHAWVTWPTLSTIWVQKSKGFMEGFDYSVGEIHQEISQKPPQEKNTAKTCCFAVLKVAIRNGGGSIGFLGVKFNGRFLLDISC